MATITITGLTAVLAGNLTDAAVIEVEDSAGASRKATVAQLRTQLSTGPQSFGSTLTASAGLTIGATTVGPGAGTIGYRSAEGLVIQGRAGSATDFALFNAATEQVMSVPVGTAVVSITKAQAWHKMGGKNWAFVNSDGADILTASGTNSWGINNNADTVRIFSVKNNGDVTVTGAFGCNTKAAQVAYAVGAASTDLASVITLANNIRTALLNNGIAS